VRSDRPIRELTLVYAGVAGATVLITRFEEVPPLSDYVHLGVGLLFLVVAIVLAQREPDGMRRHGLDLEGLLDPPPEDDRAGPLGLRDLGRSLRRAVPAGFAELGWATLLALIIFPPFTLGFFLYNQPAHPFVFEVPQDTASFVVAQVLVVGLPEEALFRGYFQTRLGDLWPRRRTLLRVSTSLPALVTQAVLFACIHFLVDLNPARLAVFFPGLLFGWVRTWRGGIGAAIFLHALSNVYADFLVRGWL